MAQMVLMIYQISHSNIKRSNSEHGAIGNNFSIVSTVCTNFTHLIKRYCVMKYPYWWVDVHKWQPRAPWNLFVCHCISAKWAQLSYNCEPINISLFTTCSQIKCVLLSCMWIILWNSELHLHHLYKGNDCMLCILVSHIICKVD